MVILVEILVILLRAFAFYSFFNLNVTCTNLYQFIAKEIFRSFSINICILYVFNIQF